MKPFDAAIIVAMAVALIAIGWRLDRPPGTSPCAVVACGLGGFGVGWVAIRLMTKGLIR